MLWKNMLVSAMLLALFAVVGTGLVAFTYQSTAERIAHNEREALLSSLHTLVPATRLDNDPITDRIEVRDPLLGTDEPVSVFRGRKDGKPVALMLAPVAPDGYGGDIKLLVAINHDGTLAGVRVVSHHETPGLGDRIEAERSDWILHFAGRSLANPKPERWKVKKDGGVFDQFTGATITPRAVVKAVYNTLRYVQAHQQALYTDPATQEGQDHE